MKKQIKRILYGRKEEKDRKSEKNFGKPGR
jgi:hypothetical protein